MPKRTIKITLKLPTGILASKELEQITTQAAQVALAAAIAELTEAQKLADELASKGIHITAAELLTLKTSKRGAKSSTMALKSNTATTRKRVVLSENQKADLVEDLKLGAKVAVAANKYGVSTATVMNLKSAAGLTKHRK